MKGNIVSVFLWGKEICRLEWRGGYRQKYGKLGAVVSFNPDYASFGWNLDPLGPYSSSVYFVRRGLSDWCRANEYEGLPRFLSGSLPDDWGNSVFSAWIDSKQIKHSDVTSVDKLAFIGKRGMGALEFVPALYDGLSPGTNLVLEDLYELSSHIYATREGLSLDLHASPGIGELMSVGMSAGGMHPKAIVAINWETGEVRSGQFMLPDEFIQYIIKFKESAAWPSSEIEYAYFILASRCGIDMEDCRLLMVDGLNHFLTKRFDRKDGKKLHTATLQALNGPTSSYEELFRVCRKLALPYHDIEQVYRRAVFNYLTGVCDDHDKNVSFVMSQDGRWRLSPAYDVTYTVNHINKFIGDRHVMSVAGHNRGLNMDEIESLAKEGDIRNARKIVSSITEVLHDSEDILRKCGIGNPILETIASYIRGQIQIVSG